MNSTTDLTVLASNLPAVSTTDDAVFNDLTKSSGFLGRLQLFTKGRAINHGLVKPGSYGIPESEDNIVDLGNSIDILPLARRVKAIDMSDKDAIISVYEVNDEYKRIQERADSGEQDTGCMYGVSFLVFERSSGRILEFFCGSKSTRAEAGKLYPFLPRMVDGIAQPPRAVNLKSKVIDKGSYSWHVPVVSECSTPMTNLPPVEVITKEIEKFLNPKTEGTEKVTKEEAEAVKRRAR